MGISAAQSLARAFGEDEVPFSVTWIGTGGNANVTRNYAQFSELAEQQARSRVYGGIHFNFELTTSQESCTKVADYVVDNLRAAAKGTLAVLNAISGAAAVHAAVAPAISGRTQGTTGNTTALELAPPNQTLCVAFL